MTRWCGLRYTRGAAVYETPPQAAGRHPGGPWHGRPWRRTRKLWDVRTQRQVVDYALRRRSLLAQLHAGHVGVDEVCDAGPYLLQAAKFHGEPSEVTCPVCRKERLTEVSWVFGEELKHASNSARGAEELARMATMFKEFNVFVVEVCRTCNWNHLVLSYVLGTGGRDDRRSGRRTAAE